MILLILSIVSLVILLAVQICVIAYDAHLFNRNHKYSWDKSQYSTTTIEHSEKVIRTVESGKIKRQLIEIPMHSSTKAVNQYIEFVDSSPLYKEISNLTESRYFG